TMTALADEGMWLLNDPPRELLQKKYGFDLTDAWLERARLASIRFGQGGSASFVSPEGLLVTNHHVGSTLLQKLSPKGKDYYRDGSHAGTGEEEPKSPDLELNVLQEIVDVTARVNAAVTPRMTPAEANAARRAAMSAIEKESLEKTGLRSDVVTLYQGGLYHLYRYKKYTDVRLVSAPEHGIASFGGDTDNFEYPRFNLDVSFFRAYENGKPARSEHYFRWSEKPPAVGDVSFVTSHPRTSSRRPGRARGLDRSARLLHRRGVTLPSTVNRVRYLEALLGEFSERGPDEARMAQKDLQRVANARKAFAGQYQGLLDPAVLAKK